MALDVRLVASAALLVITVLFLKFRKNDGPVLHPVKYRKFKLVKKTQVSPNTSIYRFQLPHAEATLGLPIGQHVSIAANINGKDIVRSYTPVSTDSVRGYFELLVKSYDKGNVSKYLNELKIGDSIRVRGPKGNFLYKPNTTKHIAMIAGGSGITPMYQILQAIAANPEDTTKATLVFANVREVDIFLREELDALSAAHPERITVHYVLNEAPENWAGFRGFVTPDVIQATLPESSPDHKLLLCGPPPMIAAMKKASTDLGWEKASIKADAQVFTF